jgi:hypothetical protein
MTGARFATVPGAKMYNGGSWHVCFAHDRGRSSNLAPTSIGRQSTIERNRRVAVISLAVLSSAAWQSAAAGFYEFFTFLVPIAGII